jgi:hypothetical protein
MYVTYQRKSINDGAKAQAVKFTPVQFTKAGFMRPLSSGMPILEAYQTVNQMNLSESQKPAPRFFYYL